MAVSLLETLKSQLSSELIGLLSRLTGEQPALTQAAAERAGEATLAGLLRQGATSEGATALARLLNDRDFHSSALADLPAQLQDSTSATGLINQGKTLLTSLFGDRVDGLVRWISNTSGVGHGSAFSMMSLIAPTVLSFIKRQFSGNADASGLWNYLSGERSALERSAPAGLLPVLGWRDWAMTPTNATEATRNVQAASTKVSAIPPAEERKDSSLYWLALPLLLLLLTGIFFMGGSNPTVAPVSSTPVVKEPPKVAPAPVAPKPEVVAPAPAVPKPAPTTVITDPQPVELVLHDNVKLMVWPDSIERKLVTFIEDKSKAPDAQQPPAKAGGLKLRTESPDTGR